MAFVYEKVKEEDRELYNSFLPNEKADEVTRWVADKERNIYFFWIGGETRECIEEYFLAWNDLKIYIYTVEKMYRDNKDIRTVHIWINTISMPNKLNNDKEKIKEIVDMIQEILQMTYKSRIIFERVVEPYFRKGDN